MRLRDVLLLAMLMPASAYAQSTTLITERDTTTTINPGTAANFSGASYTYSNTIHFNTTAGTYIVSPITIQPSATGITFSGLGSTVVTPPSVPNGTTTATVTAVSSGGAGQGFSFGYNGGDDGFLSSGILSGHYDLSFSGGGTNIVDTGGTFVSTVKILGDFSSALLHTTPAYSSDYTVLQNFIYSGGYTYFTVQDTNFQGNSPSISFSLLGAAAATPEPGTWAMMILGFGVVGYTMRRRQKITTRLAHAR